MSRPVHTADEGARSPDQGTRTAGQRTRSSDQRGVTLLEVLLALTITVIIVGPLTTWLISTMRAQADARATLSNAIGTGSVHSVFTRDIASARTVAPSGGDCVGGGRDSGSGGVVRLAVVAGGAEPTRIVYSEARTGDESSGDEARSLWRRVCAPDGTLHTASELFDNVEAGSVRGRCPTDTTPAPTPTAACADADNRRVQLRLVPVAPRHGDDGPSPIVLAATRRANSTAIGLPGGDNRPPIAQVSVDQYVGYVGQPITFDSSASLDPDGTIVERLWQFPVGETTETRTGETVSFTFDTIGEKTVVLRVSDEGGATNVAAVTVRIVNRFPVAQVVITPESGVRGVQEFTFDATGSVDPDDPSATLTYEWNLGPDAAGDPILRSGQVVTIVFPADTPRGLRQITLTVTDALGGSDTRVRQIALIDESQIPVDITITPEPVITGSGAPVVGSVGAGMADLDVRFSVPAGTPTGGTTWQLRRADGTVVATDGGTSLRYSFVAGQHGEYTILRLDDLNQPIGTPRSFRVNAAPVAAIGISGGVGDAPAAVSFNSSGSSDPDGSIVAWQWDFGHHGLPGWTGTGASPTHMFTDPGSYTVRLTVTDDSGATATAERVVTVAGTLRVPAAPTWSGQTVVIAPIPGAAEYRVSVTCNGAASAVTDVSVAASGSPTFAVPAGTCGPTPVAATVRFRVGSTWSQTSAPGVRP